MGFPSLKMINSVWDFFYGYFHIWFVENGMHGDHLSFCISIVRKSSQFQEMFLEQLKINWIGLFSFFYGNVCKILLGCVYGSVRIDRLFGVDTSVSA